VKDLPYTTIVAKWSGRRQLTGDEGDGSPTSWKMGVPPTLSNKREKRRRGGARNHRQPLTPANHSSRQTRRDEAEKKDNAREGGKKIREPSPPWKRGKGRFKGGGERGREPSKKGVRSAFV